MPLYSKETQLRSELLESVSLDMRDAPSLSIKVTSAPTWHRKSHTEYFEWLAASINAVVPLYV